MIPASQTANLFPHVMMKTKSEGGKFQMNNEIKVFNYEGMAEVRTVVKDGEVWFVAKDVCDVLEIGNSRQAVSRLDEDEKADVILNDGSQSRNFKIINEAGLYAVILGSRKPEAKQFKRWVTHEVIPSIRKHGAYMTPETLEKTLTNPDFIIQLATQLKAEQERVKELEVKNEVLSHENEVMKPKAQKYDEFLDADGLTTFTVIGKHFMNGLSAQKVVAFLQEKGILYTRKVDGVYPPKQGYEKYFRIIPFTKSDSYGIPKVVGRNVKVTNEGIDLIINLIKQY